MSEEQGLLMERKRTDAYRTRLQSAIVEIDATGWGGRARLARAIGVSQSTVSAVLNGRLVSEDYLSMIEQQLEEGIPTDG